MDHASKFQGPKHVSGAFRFMEVRFVASALAGHLRFGNLRYYRLRELAEGRWIGDSNEGLARNRIKEVELGTGRKDHERWQMPRGLSIGEVPPGSKVIGKDIVFIERVDAFVLSFSDGRLEDLVPRMCAKGGYDACLEAFDLKALAEYIWREGTVDGADRAVCELFSKIESGPVVYESNEHLICADALALRSTAFRKLPFYADQHEARIVLYPREPMRDDFVFVTLPMSGLTSLLSSRDVSALVPERAAMREPELSADQCIAQLFYLLEAIEKRPTPDPRDFQSGRISFTHYQELAEIADLELTTRFENELLRPAARAYYELRQRDRGRYFCEQLDEDFSRPAPWSALGPHLRFYLERIDPRGVWDRERARIVESLVRDGVDRERALEWTAYREEA